MSTPIQEAGDDAARQITELEARRCEAYLSRDVAALDDLLPGHFTFVRPSGIILDKSQLLRAIERGELTFESFDRHVDEVKVHINTAIAIGRDTVRASYKGRDISGSYRFVNTYVREGEVWEVVTTNSSRVQED